MDLLCRLSAFYSKACADNRLSPAHISLYFALLHEEAKHPYRDSLLLHRDLVMQKAKISSRVTYHKCMRELHGYGYVDYVPSNTPGQSILRLIELI